MALKEAHVRLKSQNERLRRERATLEKSKVDFVGEEIFDGDADLGVVWGVNVDLHWATNGFVFVEAVVFDELEMILKFIGGLGMFLYGMNVMADGLQKSAGGRLKKLMEFLTKSSASRIKLSTL